MLCTVCGKDLRSCKNCRHFIPKENGCAESQGENPSEKERANFCDWFGLNPKLRENSAGEKNSRNTATEARNAFNNLFK